MLSRTVWMLGAALCGCGANDASTGVAGGAASATSSASSGGGNAGAADAAREAAANDPLCQAIAPFYFEIGDASGSAVSGSVGDATYTASTSMLIASASKLVFGAYVLERFHGDTSKVDHEQMTMRSGNTNFADLGCDFALPATVQNCWDGGTKGKINPDPETLGSFDYSGGHFQWYATQLGLGADNASALAADYEAVLGSDLDLGFGVPAIAGGMKATPAAYAAFLRKILRGDLAIAEHLGEAAVCTLPPAEGGGDCASTFSPASPYAWHYSYGHWVEDDASVGDDGSFSSPGLYGFYPWIDASRTHYGIVARKSDDASAYLDSVLCGRSIRAAYLAQVKP